MKPNLLLSIDYDRLINKFIPAIFMQVRDPRVKQASFLILCFVAENGNNNLNLLTYETLTIGSNTQENPVVAG